MIRKRIPVSAILVVAVILPSGQFLASTLPNKAVVTEKSQSPPKADLLIRDFVFPSDNAKAVRIHIVNAGGAASTLCVMRLTVRKMNGVPLGRVVEIKLPPLAAGKDTWLVIGAGNVLPNNVTLASTTFKLNADATSIVTESNEANNEVWHNL